MNQYPLSSLKYKEKGCFLWEVKGGNARMYLNGTIHLVPKSFFPLSDEIMNRFSECRNLVVEIVLDEPQFNCIQITDDIVYNKDYTYEDGDSLYNHFPKDKIIVLRNYLIKNKLCSESIGRRFYKLKPSVVNALIIDGIYKKANLELECCGIDVYLMKKAKEMGKNLLALETKEFQMDVLAEHFNKTRANGYNRYIESSTAENSTLDEKDRKLPILYIGLFNRFMRLKFAPWALAGYVDNIASFYGNDGRVIKERKKLISKGSPVIGNRDEIMTKKLIDLLNTRDSYFIAVGAAHLLGEDSIVDRLQKQGYTVTRVC